MPGCQKITSVVLTQNGNSGHQRVNKQMDVYEQMPLRVQTLADRT